MKLGIASSHFLLDHWHFTATQRCVMPFPFSLLVVSARLRELERCSTVLQVFRGIWYIAIKICYVSACRMMLDQDIPVSP